MSRIAVRVVLALLLALVSAAAAMAQHSLFDNPNYRRSIELRRMADAAFAQSDYLKAEEYSLESERLAALAREEAETQRLLWVANSWKNRASERIAFGERWDAAGRIPAVWVEAKAAYAAATEEFNAKRYETSTAASRRVVALLADFTAPVSQVRSDPPPAAPAPGASTAPLPAFYVVRLIESARDCLWRIAEYPFVYGDPMEWPRLYEANKDKLPQPGNPDLIHPGMVLTIPSIRGEVRSGTWQE